MEGTVPVFSNRGDAVNWLCGRAEALKLSATQVPLAECAGWVTDEESVRRKDGKYFHLVGVKISLQQGREVKSWCQPMLEEVGGPGFVASVVADFDSQTMVLVRAKAEPGALGALLGGGAMEESHVLFCPTAQFSAANLEAHGASVPFSEVARNPDMKWFVPRMDAGRFWAKTNNIGILRMSREAAEAEVVKTGENAPDFAWVSQYS